MANEKGSGFWFYTTFQQCEWKGYISNYLRFRSKYLPPGMLFGGAGHEALATMWRTWDLDDAKASFILAMKAREDQYRESEKYIEDLNRGSLILSEYYDKYSSTDKEKYDIIAIEEELTVNVEEFLMTVKPDVVLFDKQRRMYIILEHKFTSWSIQKAFETVMYGDQGTTYLYAWNQKNPDKQAETVLPDILYNKGKIINCQRPSDVYRTWTGLKEFEIGWAGTIRRITQQCKAINEGHNPISIFNRRGDCDGDGAFTCEFRSICRTYLEKNNPPHGFFIKEERR